MRIRSDTIRIEVMASSTSHPGFIAPPEHEGSTRPTSPDSAPFWEAGPQEVALPGRLGQYRILERLGEGGMGIVFLAEQENPRRRVALKIIKSGFDFPRLVRRLEFEAHVLARLQHEGIAQIIESGVAATDIGPQPFLVMEYVEGQPLTAFARQRGLSTRERLKLMVEICQAVHHAHQRGVIHRDLKPGNILVTKEGKAKILDFGVAALTDVGAEPGTMYTQAGPFVGTLPYMSPEQLGEQMAPVDIRADVYALGIIAYELLTGVVPYDVSGRSVPDAVRIICEDEPSPISRYNRALRGDVQRLIAKAIDKDRDRRYPSADAFADDILRYLRDEPIRACGDSAIYVLRKYVRRHRWVAAMSALCILFLAAFAVYAGIQARVQRRLAERESEARRAANAALQAARDAESEAQAARQQAENARRTEVRFRRVAESEADRAMAVTDFLVDMLGLADPDMAQTPDRDIESMLRHASRSVAERFAGQPEAERTLRLVIGRAFAALGEPEFARVHLDAALRLTRRYFPNDDKRLYEVLWPHFHVLHDLNDIAAHNEGYEIQTLGRNILRTRHAELGSLLDQFTSFMSVDYEAERAEEVFDRILSLSRSVFAENDPDWLTLADQLYLCAYRLGYRAHPGPASRYLREALAIQRRQLPETHTRIVRTLGLLIPYTLSAGNAADAEQLARETLALLGRVLPGDHWYITVHEARHAACLVPLGCFDEAEGILRSSLRRLIAARGEFSTYVGETHKSLISLYEAWGREDEAERERFALARCLAGSPLLPMMTNLTINWITSAAPAFGPQRQELLKAVETLENDLAKASSRSRASIERFLELRRSTLPDDHPLTAVLADIMTHRVARTGPNVPVELLLKMLQEAYAWDQMSSWRHSRKSAQTRWYLSRFLLTLERFREAEALAHEAIDIMLNHPDQDYGLLAISMVLYGQTLLGQGRAEEALNPIEYGYQSLLNTNGVTDPNLAASLGALLRVWMAMGHVDKASEVASIHLQRLLDEGAGAGVLDDAAWAVATQAGLEHDAYLAAYEVSRLSVDLTPQDPYHLNTLGAVETRLGRYADAERTLLTSHAMARETNPFDPCLLAITLAHTGRMLEACHWLELARNMLPAVRVHNRAIAAQLIHEAEVLLKVAD